MGQRHYLDAHFMGILEEMIDGIIQETNQAASRVLDLSSRFLSEKARSALKNFHELYFSSEEIEKQKVDVNKNVDDIFDQVKAQMDSGGQIGLAEDEKLKATRLMLSGFQKQLETIISLDAGIREKLMPVLSTMQFEDMMKQRLTHIKSGWLQVQMILGNPKANYDELAEQLAELTSSTDETKLYYETVLKKAPPEGMGESESWIEF